MAEAPRDDLCRSVAFDLIRADDESGDGLTLDGYGAVFGEPTRIDSWEGTFDEVIAAGAFKKSLRERTPKLQFDHGYHPLIGSIPIGRIEQIGEDDRGLHVVARLSDNWLVEPIRDAIRDGAVDGMSFRFSVVRDDWHDAQGKKLTPTEVDSLLWQPDPVRAPLLRTLKEVRVSEVGPVVWPAYQQTSVSVRSEKVVIDLGRLNEPGVRKTLADAVFRADAAARTAAPSAPPVTDQADGHPEVRDDAPQTTDDESAGEHPSEVTAAAPGLRARIQRQAALRRQQLALSLPREEASNG